MTSVGPKEIVAGLRRLGLATGSRVLVHSSLSSFGHVEGGAGTVIDALLKAVGSSGTVLVPTLTATAQHSSQNPPVFDATNTPCWTGRIPETFRMRPEAIRSLHPTHSVAALGAEADELTRDHTYSVSPCDELSPYGKLAQDESGFVLLLGVGHKSNTTFHHIEELAGAEYHMQRDLAKATIIANGEEVQRNYMLHQWGTPRQFEIMEPLYIERGIQQTAQIGKARVSLVQSLGMVQATLRALRSNPRILCKN
jgi:aminoglycoside 3-N-acetyltransferase